MSFNKVGFAVASKMDEILTSKAFKKIAKKEEDAECCEGGCEKDCKCKKKVATKNDIIVSLISTSERLDRLGFNKIAQDLLDPADDLLEESEEDEVAGLSKEKSLDLDVEDEEFDDIINDLKNGDSWSEKSFDDIDEDGGSLFDSQDEDEEEDEDDFMAWDANDGDLVDNLKLDSAAAWDDEYHESLAEEDDHLDNLLERSFDSIDEDGESLFDSQDEDEEDEDFGEDKYMHDDFMAWDDFTDSAGTPLPHDMHGDLSPFEIGHGLMDHDKEESEDEDESMFKYDTDLEDSFEDEEEEDEDSEYLKEQLDLMGEDDFDVIEENRGQFHDVFLKDEKPKRK